MRVDGRLGREREGGGKERERGTRRVGHRFPTFCRSFPRPPVRLFSRSRILPTARDERSMDIIRCTMNRANWSGKKGREERRSCILSGSCRRLDVSTDACEVSPTIPASSIQPACARVSGGNRFTWISIIVIKHAASMNYLSVGRVGVYDGDTGREKKSKRRRNTYGVAL